MEPVLRAADWTEHDTVSVRGRAFDGANSTRPLGADDSGEFLEADTLAARFAAALESDSGTCLESIAETAASLEGYFAAVVSTREARYLISDGARSIPLFYDASGTVVSDRGRLVRDAIDAPRNPVTESELLLTRYVTGPETIWERVFAVQPGEVVRLENEPPESDDAITRYTYRDYWPVGVTETPRDANGDGDRNELEPDERSSKADGCDPRALLEAGLETALDRLEAIAGDRPVVVPLSGGYDSRLLASALVERDREVIGFTFGRSGHPDVEASREVAARLGIRWEFFEYGRSEWREWYHGEAGRRYRTWAFGGDALPFLAAWPAVAGLLETGRLPEDALYCPGHTVATPSERLPRFASEDRLDPTGEVGCGPVVDADEAKAERPLVEPTVDGLTEYILERHYELWEWDDERFRRFARERIRRGLLGTRPADAVRCPKTAAAAYERWEWRGRMSTFTNGDLRLYEDRGLDWWLPLWDPAYVRAWAGVPLERRRGKELHAELAVDTYRRVTGISSERAAFTDRTLPPVDRYLSLIRHTPERQFLERDGRPEPSFLAPRSHWSEPGSHPLAWYGAVDSVLLDRLPPDRNFYALRTLAETGRLDFADPESWVPDGDVLELPTADRSDADSGTAAGETTAKRDRR